MKIQAAIPADAEPAVRCIVRAFADDPITGYFFASVPEQRSAATGRFFSLLLRARLALEMPVLLAWHDAQVVGVAMGYDSRRPPWPADLNREWKELEASVPGMAARTAVYDEVSRLGTPDRPHYYLGVIGVAPEHQGRGIGQALLQAFSALSANDPNSCGVYLETATPTNLGFYEKSGFREKHRGAMGAATLWCLFLPQKQKPASGYLFIDRREPN